MPAKHYVFTALPAWGHVKSFCTLGARLVKEDDSTIVTMILDARILDKAREEISVELGGKDLPGVGQRIRVLAAGQNDSLDFLEMMKSLAESYAPAYKALAEGKPVTCAATGTVFDSVIPPSAVILDFFVYPQLQSTRAVTGTSVPVFAWMTGHASSMIRIFGPEELGGAGDWRAKIEAEAARLGVTPESIGEKLVRQTDGKIVNIPGLPPMYDYEWYPQKLPFKIPASNARRGCVNLLKECDGVLITTAYAFEPVALEAMKSSWFASWNKPTYVIGPVLPTGFGESIAQTPKGANEVQEFLTKALEQHGEKSVLFISFGTFFYPTDLGYLEELLEALIEKEFPFIFCYASPFATMTQELLDKAASSGLGLITKWAPQQYILSHPATGWFVTHCGHNSAMESLACGIPLIAWPFEADQPGAAAHLTENLKVAFELIEVRTGEHGLRPLLRNGCAAKGTREAVGVEIREIIDAARGPRGEQLRKNAQEMQVKFSGAWKEDGSSRKELLKFIADCA